MSEPPSPPSGIGNVSDFCYPLVFLLPKTFILFCFPILWVSEWVNACCLTPSDQYFSYITAQIAFERWWWWYPLCTRHIRLVWFLSYRFPDSTPTSLRSNSWMHEWGVLSEQQIPILIVAVIRLAIVPKTGEVIIRLGFLVCGRSSVWAPLGSNKWLYNWYLLPHC